MSDRIAVPRLILRTSYPLLVIVFRVTFAFFSVKNGGFVDRMHSDVY